MGWFLRWGRIALFLLLDILAVSLAFYIALELRFELEPQPKSLINLTIALPVVIAVFVVFMVSVGIYTRKWKAGSFDEVVAIARATFLSFLLITFSLLAFSSIRAYVPFSVTVVGATIAFLCLSAIRISRRITNEVKTRRNSNGGTRVLVIGAGEAGEMITRDLLLHPTYGYKPVAFVDDNPRKHNLILQGMPVVGGREKIAEIVDTLGIEEIFITIPSANVTDIGEIVETCKNTSAKIKILPGIVKTLQENPSFSEMRELRVEDLLGREPVELGMDCEYITGETVLVTGAAGSIGSELSRQILGFHPELLLLLDNNESALFNLHRELSAIDSRIEIVVADIRERKRIQSIYQKYQPAVVFHSAALKHVPMMESHPCEAVKNNIMGTMNLAEAAIKSDCKRFIFISTDKAVQPSNIMGTTKRLAELLVRKCNTLGNVRFGAVRFGNVLGSRGSVVPLFESQIENGGPVQVTHPEMTRYFMTTNEAAQLVIQAGVYLGDGELFLLDMGEPVKILDLAKKMIAIKGNGHPIDIQFTGLRPGEKLCEELTYQYEQLSPTTHPKIATITELESVPDEYLFNIMRLVHIAAAEQEEETRQMLADMVQAVNCLMLDSSKEAMV